jgi:hypothetical protein
MARLRARRVLQVPREKHFLLALLLVYLRVLPGNTVK